MVQKEFRKIQGWYEWLELWEKNDVEEIALGLLHAGPVVPFRTWEEARLKSRFYLEVAKSLENTGVGLKAYEVWVQRYPQDLIRYLSDISEVYAGSLNILEATSLLEETLDFLVEKTAEKSYAREPSKSHIIEFIKSLWDRYSRPDKYDSERWGIEILKRLPQREKTEKAVVKILENLKEFQLLGEYGFLKVTIS